MAGLPLATTGGAWCYGGRGAGVGPRPLTPEIVARLARAARLSAASVDRSVAAWISLHGSALDVPVRAPSAQRAVTLRALFEALRRAGVRPHARGEEGDEAVARELVEAWASAARAPREEAVVPLPIVGLAEGAFARTWPVLWEWDEGDPRRPEEYQAGIREGVGSYAQMLADIARMGAGRVRRLQQSEPEYRAVFPLDEWPGNFNEWGSAVLPPGELLAELRNDDYRRFAGTTPVVVLGVLLGVKLDLCPVLGMGGYRLSVNANHIEGGDAIPLDEETDAVDSTGAPATADAIGAARPPWQSGFLVPSGEGWSPFYWDEPRTDPMHLGAPPTQDEVEYQRLALNVWPTSAPGTNAPDSAPNVDEVPSTSWYARECARRKSLFVAAYATGLAEWLARLDGVIATELPGADIYDVVDTLELANEPDGYWDYTVGGEQASNAAMEVGRHLALIAGPVLALLPGMRFRVELHDWKEPPPDPKTEALPLAAPHDDLDARLGWFREVVTRGMQAETDWWRTVQRVQAYLELDARGLWPPRGRPSVVVPATLEWYRTCDLAGFAWPPRLFDDPAAATETELWAATEGGTTVQATQLIHQFGYHWYHHTDTDRFGFTDLTGYAMTNRLGADLRRFRALSTELAKVGFTLGFTVGEICFPAHTPGDPGNVAPPATSWATSYYATATPLLQAAMYVRLLAVCLGEGTESAKLYTFNYGAELASSAYDPAARAFTFYQTTRWGTYSTSGVHNDVTTEEGFEGRGAMVQARDLWPRPAWFAFRRFGWLLARAGNGRSNHTPAGVRVVSELDRDGMHVIELTFATEVSTGPDGQALRAGWQRAYLMWIDQHAVDLLGAHTPTTVALSFDDSASGEGYELLSIVPDVVPQASPEGALGRAWNVDDNGYSLPSEAEEVQPNPDWHWDGWDTGRDAGASSSEVPDGSGAFTIVLVQCDPAGGVALAPLLILTNAELVTT